MKVFTGNESAKWDQFNLVGSESNRIRLFRLGVSGATIKDAEDGFRSVDDVAWAKSFKEANGDDLAKREANVDPASIKGIKLSENCADIPLLTLIMFFQKK